MRTKSGSAGVSPARGANIEGWGTSDELFSASRQPAADAPHNRRDRPRVLLCGAGGVGVNEFRRLRPALAHTLNDDRRNAETFQHAFSIPLVL